MKGLLRLILLKTIWLGLVVPSVLTVSLLVSFLIARGISRLLGRDMDELGTCFLAPVAISLLLFSLYCMARLTRKFDERKAAQGGREARPPCEGATLNRPRSSGPGRTP